MKQNNDKKEHVMKQLQHMKQKEGSGKLSGSAIGLKPDTTEREHPSEEEFYEDDEIYSSDSS